MSEEKVSSHRCGKCGKNYEEAGHYLGVLFADESNLSEYGAEISQIEYISFPWGQLGRRNYRNACMFLLCWECERDVNYIIARPRTTETGYRVMGVIE